MMREHEARSRPLAKRLRSEMTKAEILFWGVLRCSKQHRFRRQHPIGPYVADFACASARLVIEIDGGSHDTPWGMRHDARRTEFLNQKGWLVVRYANTDIYKNLEGVWIGIQALLPPPSPAATPPP